MREASKNWGDIFGMHGIMHAFCENWVERNRARRASGRGVHAVLADAFLRFLSVISGPLLFTASKSVHDQGPEKNGFRRSQGHEPYAQFSWPRKGRFSKNCKGAPNFHGIIILELRECRWLCCMRWRRSGAG